jgi:hypothetical protein
MNNHGIGFQAAQVYAINSCTNEIASGDVDGDEVADIVVAHESNRWTYLRNNQQGGFTNMGATLGIEAGSIPDEPTIHLADIDIDGDLDVFFSNRDTGGVLQGAVGLWRNNGNGTFAPGEELSFNWATTGSIDTNTGDVTGDGWPDLFCATGNLQWVLFVNNGAGGFLPPRLLQAGDSPSSIDLADLENDGDLDVIVVAARSLEACVYLNPGDGSFVQPPALDFADPAIAPAFTTNIDAGDLDGDADLDIVVGFRSDFSNAFGITVRRNNGDGTFGPRETYSEPLYPAWIKLADMDEDGDQDILFIDANSRFYIRKNNGSGSFNTRLARHLLSAGADDMSVNAVDVDGDGDLDVTANAGFNLKISRNQGNDSFSTPYNAATVDGWMTTYAFGHYNQDGVLDLLANTGVQGYPEIMFGTGNGFFGTGFTVPTGRDVHSFGVGDLDQDGNLDFAAIFNLDEKGLSIRRGRGDGNFFLPAHQTGSFQWGDYTISGRCNLVDINEDGFEDILFANVLAQDFSFWLNNGDGTFQRPIRYGAGHQVHDLIVADFTGDGIPDAAMSTQIDDGKWFHTGVVIIAGLGASSGHVAPLTEMQVVTGELLNGGLNELMDSDDAHVQIRNSAGNVVGSPNVIELRVGASAAQSSPATIELTIEARQDTAGQARIRLRNWQSGAFDQVGTLTLGTADDAQVLAGIAANQYVRGDGEIELSIIGNAMAPTIPLRVWPIPFQLFVDQVQIKTQ